MQPEQALTNDTVRVPSIDLATFAIFLDVDGTLLDIAAKPDAVRVPAPLRGVLQRLADRVDGALAFVSGRPIADLDRIFAPLKLPAAGGHGAELRTSGGGEVVRTGAARLDDRTRQLFAEVAELAPGILIESKPYSLALHYRQAPQIAARLRERVMEISGRLDGEALEILPGKAVIEIKPQGFSKGTALRDLMRHPPFAGRRPLFIGDDKTDDAAFAVLPEFDGIGISVGGPAPGARYCLDMPEDVRSWLQRLAESGGGAGR
jgi:trehalose 6-phosphate phosphatase